MIHEDTRALDRGNVFFHYRMREARFHFAYRKDSFRDLSYYVYSRGTVTSERIYKKFLRDSKRVFRLAFISFVQILYDNYMVDLALISATFFHRPLRTSSGQLVYWFFRV